MNASDSISPGTVAIDIEHVSKEYVLGDINIRRLRQDFLAMLSGSKHHDDYPDDKGSRHLKTSGTSSIWALKDVSLSIKKGSVIGIIGKNGAGKSTLLKLLSRITSPTRGIIKINGSIASLLEVGTGFHPDLTGRENVYMNGAILGLRRQEIRKRFDEIVDFSGIASFIDTPVKRYSSGMYVRLAFSVAAHLEPDILLVDEVLAVGDAQFQKKCLGKMKDVSAKDNRTIVFVSHNMAAIRSLCSSGVFIRDGMVEYTGDIDQTITRYLAHCFENSKIDIGVRSDRRGSGKIRFRKVQLLDNKDNVTDSPITGNYLKVRLSFDADSDQIFRNCRISCAFYCNTNLLFVVSSEMVTGNEVIISGNSHAEFIFNSLPLSSGSYYLTLFVESNNEILDWIEEAITFDIVAGDFFGFGKNKPEGWNEGTVLVPHEFKVLE